MKERFKSAIKGNSFIVWLRIIYEKIGESFSLTLYNGSTNQTKDILRNKLNCKSEYMPWKRECLLVE